MKKIFKYLKPYRFFAILSPLLMMGEVLIDLLQPDLMSTIVDDGILGGDLPLILRTGVKMLLLVIVGGIFGMSCSFTSTIAAQRFGRDLRNDVFRHVMNLSPEQSDFITAPSLVTRLSNDVSMLQEAVSMLLRMVIRAPIFFIGGIIMALAQNVRFGLVLLISLPVMVVIMLFVMKKATPLFMRVQKKLDKVNSVVRENVGGARVVKAYVQEDHEIQRFDEANTDLMGINLRVYRIMALINPAIMIVMNLSVCAIIYIGGIQVDLQKMRPGDIMAAVTYISMILSSVMMVGMSFVYLTRCTASAQRINEILDFVPVISDGNYPNGMPTEQGTVELKDVKFRYAGSTGDYVLKDIDIKINRGETFAIVGSTGCGKTTLVALIERYYDAVSGSVKVDGIDVKDYKLSDLRAKMGYVMQRSELFSDTVKNNILWGKPDATDEEVREAARIAQSDDFVSAMPDGYDTYIAEKGASLSGGQKQRLSIARALIRKPEILILDDSTSALDLDTEARLMDEIYSKFDDITVIMIAQRIASVKRADRIAVLENGVIVACDTHDNLLKNCEVYKEIYRSQLKGGGSDD